MSYDSRIAQAILNLSTDAGHPTLTRTAFVKFLYLLDVLVAETTEGQKYTPWEWKFAHFGPYCAEAVDLIEEDPLIDSRRWESDADADGYLYGFRSGIGRVVTLDDLGVPTSVQTKLARYLRRLAKELPQLLDFVYFDTVPMQGAKPGQVLLFDKCRVRNISEVRPLAFPRMSEKRKTQAKERIRKAREERLAQKCAQIGAIDEAYLTALAALDDETPVNGAGRAIIKAGFDGDT